MTTLRDLIEEFGAEGFILADDGNGSAFGGGVFIDWSTDTAAEHGDLELTPLTTPHTFSDGVECNWASDWVEMSEDTSNPYRIQVFF